MGTKSIEEDVRMMKPLLAKIEVSWEAKQSIICMRDNGYSHWRQMEWFGFYFQFRCEKLFKELMKFQEPTYGNSSFDGLLNFPWDFKAHPINKKDGKPNNDVITNDSEAINLAIKDYGCTGLVLASGIATYNDLEGTFKRWHDELKGSKTEYVKRLEKEGAPSRLRKTHFELKRIDFIKVDNSTMQRSDSFQKGMRNSNTKPRREKVKFNTEKLLPEDYIDCIEF